MSDLSKFLRDDVALIAKSKALGLHREINPDMARIAYVRAAEEIEKLESTIHSMRERNAVS